MLRRADAVGRVLGEFGSSLTGKCGRGPQAGIEQNELVQGVSGGRQLRPGCGPNSPWRFRSKSIVTAHV
jgi:hypothetical protein